MASKRSWTAHPSKYRTREVAVLAKWIRAGESGSIVGLPGAGKSNLLAFLCHRPDIIQTYLANDNFKLALVLVDLNNLPNNDLATFYRVILRALFEARNSLANFEAELSTAIENLYRKVEEKTDPFLSQSALREALLLFQAAEIRLVLMLDPFDHFCQTVATQILDNLRGLRDGFKTTLSYLIGVRHEVVYLRDPSELGELHEILDRNLCWIGALELEDANWFVDCMEEATQQIFSEMERQKLIELTGGYPALLRVASFWLAANREIPDLWSAGHTENWIQLLLADEGLQNRLEELQQGLTAEEEAVFVMLQMALALKTPQEQQKRFNQIEEKHKPALRRLKDKKLCFRTETGWQIFSPLFAEFMKRKGIVNTGKIWRLDRNTDRFFQGEQEITGLSKKDCQLLHYFFDHIKKQTHSIDALIIGAWSDQEPGDVSTEAVQQAVYHLRKRIETNLAEPRYLITKHGIGYSFFPEGIPQG